MSALVHAVHTTVQFATEDRDLPDADDFRAWVDAVMVACGRRDNSHSALTVRLVGEAESAALNGSFRGVKRQTNVLAFPVEYALGVREVVDEPELGDLVICAPVVAREADEQGKTLMQHYAHMTVHGCLHLLGYDHQTDAEADDMESMEIRILEYLGFPDPYANHNRGSERA